MSDAPSFSVAGGGSIAVDTGSMLAAARMLDDASTALRGVRAALADLDAAPTWVGLRPDVRSSAATALAEAARSCAAALETAGTAQQALAIAADRYGEIEAVATRVADSAAAGIAATAGAVFRVALAVSPGAAIGVSVAGAGLVAAADAPIVIGRIVRRDEPFTDPALIAELRLAIGSIDDATRGFFLAERPTDLMGDRPGGEASAAAVSAELAAALQAVAPVDRRVDVLPIGTPEATTAPSSLERLAERVPRPGPGEPQIRIDRLVGADGVVRWIVAIAGTVTFALDSGSEPFDTRSDLEGVGGVASDSERAVLQAMAASGIRPGDPVLLVGHSQGALDAVRVAQTGRYAVAGVVTLGGPSGQLTLPAGMPELSVEHANDVVPVLGGLAAAGAAGRRRVVVRRTVPQAELADEPVAAHDPAAYDETVELAERSGAPQITAFERAIAPFLAGDGTTVDWRADRASDRRAPRPRTR